MARGFNSEIVFEGTLFHIQTEARKEAGIETAVYVKGAVVHSVKTSHPGMTKGPAVAGQEFTRLLEEQHRQVIARIRAGEIKPSLMQLSGPDPLEK
jgi:hypothetical protein